VECGKECPYLEVSAYLLVRDERLDDEVSQLPRGLADLRMILKEYEENKNLSHSLYTIHALRSYILMIRAIRRSIAYKKSEERYCRVFALPMAVHSNVKEKHRLFSSKILR